ncbi:hypothetical protein [Streptomyces endophytica]|uniref:Uncharacterized protein n=1 Tax=Streptomyces endophytica TaxID=2991496 RepID=A0ABY6PG74_9ACTN|nr:hypothetical protein [Streptomyces endophytica]UZJ32873.1 hypothetical protein OJ254_24525 [Streptomyces endophytica]
MAPAYRYDDLSAPFHRVTTEVLRRGTDSPVRKRVVGRLDQADPEHR